MLDKRLEEFLLNWRECSEQAKHWREKVQAYMQNNDLDHYVGEAASAVLVKKPNWPPYIVPSVGDPLLHSMGRDMFLECFRPGLVYWMNLAWLREFAKKDPQVYQQIMAACDVEAHTELQLTKRKEQQDAETPNRR